MTPNCNVLLAGIIFVGSSPSAGAFLAPSHHSASRPTTKVYSIIDDLKLIFSEEGRANREAYVQREREEMEAAQREIMERRRNPEIMEKYEEDVAKRRNDLQKEKDVWSFQQKTDGTDALDDWNRLREEGKIKVGSDLERDASSSRLGSEGLVDVRVDELLPYIDQGYVDEDADVMGKMFGGLFGGNKNKE
eukprot:CAMPEP_0197718422 /NCGR_PEP_ID=MMETSP1434-20131217/2585_1 /TAXON_ID=265543 /ORGANISM="Minutocellus polymorphus, Strain CCMP3303" /LENGTH=190 /DNA_ID=CAMNT_0043303073 /DNA_START=130 /DNA_END=702 /DNA_ORIENTATION=+